MLLLVLFLRCWDAQFETLSGLPAAAAADLLTELKRMSTFQIGAQFAVSRAALANLFSSPGK